jgi:DNA (cytosine-5)-methyltransferase 1
LQRHLEAGGKARQGAAPDAEGGARGGCWWDGGQVNQTLDAVLSKGQTMPEKNRFPAVLQPVPFTKAKRAQTVTDDETWVQGQVNPTLSLFDQGDTRATTVTVAIGLTTYETPKFAHEVQPTLTVPSPSGGGQPPAVAHAMTVRRLSAEECEALQGFSRGWTRIPWRGKPAEQCPDGPRYKALGNSMACNCMAWIGEKIAKWEADHA